MTSIAFRAKRPMNYEIFRPVHRRLLEDPRMSIVLYGKQQGRSDSSLFDRVGALPARRRPNWMAKFSSPDVLFSADWLLATRRARATIQMFHGISGKGHNMNKRVLDYDHVFVIGPWLERRLIERGFFQAGDPRLLPVGMPKTDRLTDGSLDRAATLRAFGLDPDVPTVLYAPTWGPESSLEEMGHQVLSVLAGIDANVIVKLHDNSYDPRYAQADWSAALDGVRRPGLVTPAVSDVIPLMHAADLLVTDFSSVAFEWLHLDRPSILLTFPDQLKHRADRADVTTWRDKMARACDDVRALPELIATGLDRPDEFADVRRAALHDVYYNPGNATDAAIEQTYSILGIGAPAAAATA